MRQSPRNHRRSDQGLMPTEFTKRLQILSRQRLAVGAGLLALAAAAAYGLCTSAGQRHGNSDVSSQSRKGLQRYTPTPAEWASLTFEPVTERAFRAEHVTEGKIAVDEDRSTPVFSPYAGRVTKLLARPGDSVTQGPAAVRDRSRRHRAGAERFHRRHDRAEQGASRRSISRRSRTSAPRICSKARRSR